MIELSAVEARVLGCLMEKAVTTPDNYPLSVNALINVCNQSTNRDPIVSYDENTVEHALEALREKGVSRRRAVDRPARGEAQACGRRGVAALGTGVHRVGCAPVARRADAG